MNAEKNEDTSDNPEEQVSDASVSASVNSEDQTEDSSDITVKKDYDEISNRIFGPEKKMRIEISILKSKLNL